MESQMSVEVKIAFGTSCDHVFEFLDVCWIRQQSTQVIYKMSVRTRLESRFKIIAMLTSPPWCTKAWGFYSCRVQVFCTQSKHPRYLPRGVSGWEVLCSPWLGNTISLALHCINFPSIQLATSTSPPQLQTTTKSREVNRIFFLVSTTIPVRNDPAA